jgi:hypothetical protein
MQPFPLWEMIEVEEISQDDASREIDKHKIRFLIQH